MGGEEEARRKGELDKTEGKEEEDQRYPRGFCTSKFAEIEGDQGMSRGESGREARRKTGGKGDSG